MTTSTRKLYVVTYQDADGYTFDADVAALGLFDAIRNFIADEGDRVIQVATQDGLSWIESHGSSYRLYEHGRFVRTAGWADAR